MVCSCCGAKKGLFDMFYTFKIGEEKINLCSDCRDVVERLQSDASGGEMELYEIHLFQLQKRAKNPTSEFLSWQSAYFSKEN